MSSSKRLIGGGSDVEIELLLARGIQDLRAKTAAHQGAWGLGDESDWDLDQEVGDITFSFDDGLIATARAQIIGTFNALDDTWLWAWANPSIDESLARDALALKRYGQQHAIKLLTDPKCKATEERAWELTGLAVHLNEAQGAYRGPAGTAFAFITFGEVRLSRSPGEA